jgi:hypothetical protein
MRQKLIKIGAKVVFHARYVTFQMTEVAVPREVFKAILERIERHEDARSCTGLTHAGVDIVGMDGKWRRGGLGPLRSQDGPEGHNSRESLLARGSWLRTGCGKRA